MIEGGLGRVSKRQEHGRWKKALKNWILWNLNRLLQKIPITFPFDQCHFNHVSAEVLFHGSHLVMYGEGGGKPRESPSLFHNKNVKSIR